MEFVGNRPETYNQPDIGVSFLGIIHQPLNMQGVLRLEDALRDIAATPERNHIVVIEEAGLTPPDAHAWAQRFRYEGFRRSFVRGLLAALLKRKPTDRETQSNIDRIDTALNEQDINRLINDQVIGPNGSHLFDYAKFSSLDILRTNRIRFEFESHKPGVNQAEKQAHNEFSQLSRLARANWRHQSYDGFLDAAEPACLELFRSTNIRDIDIAQQFKPRLEKMIRDHQRGMLTFIFGSSHKLDRCLQESLSPDTVGSVSFTADRGIHETSNEWRLFQILRRGLVAERVLFGKYFLEMFTMEAIANWLVSQGRSSAIAYNHEGYQSSVSDLVANLSDQDMRGICEGQLILQVPDIESQNTPIYLNI